MTTYIGPLRPWSGVLLPLGGSMKLDLSVAEVTIVRQALMLRAAQLRRAINVETDSSILAIRQQQFKVVDSLIATFSEVK